MLHAWVSELCCGVVECPNPTEVYLVKTGGGGCHATPGCISACVWVEVCVCVWAMPYFLVWCPIGHAHYTCSNRPPFKAKPSRGKDRPREQSRCFHMLLIDRQVPFLMLSATRHLEFSLFQFTSMLRLPWHNRSVGLSLQTFEVCKPSAAPDLTQAVPWFKQSPFQFFRKRDPTRRMHVIRTRGLEEHETDWSVWDFSVSSKLTEHVCIFYSS